MHRNFSLVNITLFVGISFVPDTLLFNGGRSNCWYNLSTIEDILSRKSNYMSILMLNLLGQRNLQTFFRFRIGQDSFAGPLVSMLLTGTVFFVCFHWDIKSKICFQNYHVHICDWWWVLSPETSSSDHMPWLSCQQAWLFGDAGPALRHTWLLPGSWGFETHPGPSSACQNSVKTSHGKPLLN